jgi:hypothetical protein
MSVRLVFLPLLLIVFCTLTQAQDDEMASEESSESAPEMVAEESSESVSIVSVRYLCELQGVMRRVEVDYESTDTSVPCSVNYFKDTEAPGDVNTLWSATNIEGYCEEKAAGFIDKLKSWGWSCTDS